MGTLTPRARRLARASLLAVWLGTSMISLLELHGRSQALLQQALVPPTWQSPLILGGALSDAIAGFALWHWHQRSVYLLVGVAMLLLTLAATVVQSTLWLDPLGCLSKNLPSVYWQHARLWERLGYPAFIAMLAVFYLMVAKPVLW